MKLLIDDDGRAITLTVLRLITGITLNLLAYYASVL